MWNGKYISILSIVDTIYSRFRNTVLLEDFSLGDASEWAYHAMGLIGAGIGYIQKVTDGNEELNHQEPVIVENYIGLLPEDLYLIKGVREYYYKIPFRESNYIYHTSLNDAQLEQNLKREQTYYINNGVIYVFGEKFYTIRFAFVIGFILRLFSLLELTRVDSFEKTFVFRGAFPVIPPITAQRENVSRVSVPFRQANAFLAPRLES